MSRSGRTGSEWLSPSTIDGRGFGVVMAFSFCCAPLHAVRYFSQPPQGAERFRDRLAGSDLRLRIVVKANLTVGFSSPIALGGYRPWGCQVAGKCPPMVLNAAETPAQTRPPKGPAAACFESAIRSRRTRSRAGAG